MNPSQIVDLIVLAVLLFCTIRGATRGLLSQLAWAAALLLCFKFSGTLSPLIEPLIAVDPPLKHWISMLVIYVVLCGATFLGAGLVSKWLEDARLGGFDRHLGALLGLVRGIVICMTAMYFLITMSADIRRAVSQTWSGYGAALILSHSQVLLQLVPEHSVGDVEQVLNRFGQNLQAAGDELANAKPASAGVFSSEGVEKDQESWLGPGGSGFDLRRLAGQSEDRPASDKRAQQPAEVDSASAVESLLSAVPQELRDQLLQQLSEQDMNRLLNTAPEERRRLVQQLISDATGEAAGSVWSGLLRRVSGGTTAGDSERGSGVDEQGAGVRRPPLQLSAANGRLLDEIAGIYSQRADIIQGTREHLSGLPDVVVRRVLEDWHADALGLSRDPDIGTDLDTRLDERILRQLSRAGVTVDQLDRSLRSRLNGI